ncbi:PREDICTED: uncharacterized protein LOC109130865 [Camelina sativa]|uniref:ATP-dependent DNA helicase n=1 Tax=Camelina sativa TaxID=90675 RepID=A0ABM1RBV0_CAMSA|nr:PREDICTED: uncharacterized protein LOC109130865 [Camelina sativa]
MDDTNLLIVDEKDYDRAEQQEKHDTWIKSMTDEQKQIYAEIMEAVVNDIGGVSFVYHFGGTDQAQLVTKASLFIWDEAQMMSKHCFEPLDRILSDIIKGEGNRPFGGKVVVFGGDFRQVVPIIPNAGRAEICMSALNTSYLWDHCKVLRLTKNMRLLAKNLNPTAAKEIKEFSDWILKVGDGNIAEPNEGEVMIDIHGSF